MVFEEVRAVSPASTAKPPVLQSAPKRSSAEERRVLVDFLIDEWGEESFPASDPPGGLPPSLARPTKPL